MYIASIDTIDEIYTKLQDLKRALPKVIVKVKQQLLYIVLTLQGVATISRAVINEIKNGKKQLLIEGYGLRHVMNTVGVVGERTSTNNIMEMCSVLGIEAARSSIVREIDNTMGNDNSCSQIGLNFP